MGPSQWAEGLLCPCPPGLDSGAASGSAPGWSRLGFCAGEAGWSVEDDGLGVRSVWATGPLSRGEQRLAVPRLCVQRLSSAGLPPSATEAHSAQMPTRPLLMLLCHS